jgi:hypothetical protein
MVDAWHATRPPGASRGANDVGRAGWSFPRTDNGASTVVPGLFFCGVHFLRKRRSSVLFGVGEDAAIVAQSIACNQPQPRTTPPSA